jgi:putative transposase
MHCIVVLVGATLAVAQNTVAQNINFSNGIIDKKWALASPTRTTGISDIVGAYKSLVFKSCLDIYKSNDELMGKLWQRNYYEHIIRNENAYHNISNYIINNPAKWSEDKFSKK